MAGKGAVVEREPALYMRVLDGFSLEDSSGRDLTISNKKARGLLAYLALNQRQSESRERLAGLFWSDRSEKHARATLRQCLKQLRWLFGEAGFDGFEADRQSVSLRKDRLRIDLLEVADGLTRGEVGAELVDGGALSERILYGFEGLDESYTAWLYVLRKNWHDRFVETLQTMLRGATCETDMRRRSAEALVSIDPTHEEAHRFLIRHNALDGNVAAALRQYKTLWDLLDESYDMEPADETQALIADIKSGRLVGSPPVEGESRPSRAGMIEPKETPAPASGLPVIGIGAFVRGGPWDQEDYLISGFRRELIASLVRFREWVVVEDELRDSDGEQPSKEGPSQFHSDYLLEGAYFGESGTVRLVITLRETVSGRYIWSEQIALTLDSWFQARLEIVRRISVALNIYLSVERLASIAGRGGVSLDVYDRWLHGQDLSFRWRPETCTRAAVIFRSIINEAPDFAPAYSGLVQIENSIHLISPGVFRDPGRHSDALRLAKTAVQIDPLDSRTQLCLAWSYGMNGRFDQAEFHHRLALKLNENDPWTMVSAALGLVYCDQTEEAGSLAAMALQLDANPSPSHWAYQAGVRFLCGDYAGCSEAAERGGDVVYYLPAWRAAAMALLERSDEAAREAERFLSMVLADWQGDEMPSREAAGRWLLHSFPIRSKGARERLRLGANLAGIPAAE